MSCDQTELEYYVGDRLPEIFVTYYYIDSDGETQYVNVTGYTFALLINFDSGAKSIAGVIVDATNGEFKFPFGASDIDEAGKFTSQIVITDDSSRPITYEFVKFNVKARIL